MTTPFDVYMSLLNEQKQAADALVPGHVGMGINSGHQDSDAAEASQSALARNRADMQAMALISGSADGGAGYSTPPPATSPSLQMQADIKAAAVMDEAIKFAEYIYQQTKSAHAAEKKATAMEAAAAVPKGRLAEAADALWARRSHLGIGAGGLAVGGAAGYAAASAAAPAAQPVPDDALKMASAVLEALGLQAVPKQAGLGQMADNAAGAAAQFVGKHKAPLAAGAAGLALGAAGGGAAGFAGGAWTGHQAAAAQQAAMAAMAQEQGQARHADPGLAMKEASLQQAAEAGRMFALQQLGVAQ